MKHDHVALVLAYVWGAVHGVCVALGLAAVILWVPILWGLM